MGNRTAFLLRSKFSEYLFPSVLTTAAVSVASVVDGVIVGNLLGDSALAAVGLTSPFIFGNNAIFALFAVGGVTCASIAKGERKEEQANRYFTACLYAGIAIMLLYALAVTLFASPLCGMLARGNVKLAEDACLYITSLIWAGPFLFFSLCIAQFWKIEGTPNAAIRISLIANGVNLILDYVLIRFLDTGISGAGISTTLGYIIGTLCTITYFRWSGRNFRFLCPGRWLLSSIHEIVNKGAYRSLTALASLVQNLVINTLIVSAFGPGGLAVLTICINSLMIANIFVGGASETLQPIIATLFGEKDIYGIRMVFKRALLITLVLCTSLATFYAVFPGAIGALFGNTTNTDVLYTALRLYAIYIPLYVASQLLQTSYNSTGHSKLSVFMSAIEGFVLVNGFALLLNMWNTHFLWLCYALSSVIILLLSVILAAWIRRRDSALHGLLLLPKQRTSVPWERSLIADNNCAVELSKDIRKFGNEHGFSKILANHIALASEEMVVNIAVMNRDQKPVTIDAMIYVSNEEILLRLRNNGVLFNPLTYDKEDVLIHDRINLIVKLANGVAYSHQLGFNTVILSFFRSKVNTSI